MSKSISIIILAILLVLLGVMSFVLQKAVPVPKKPETPPPPAAKPSPNVYQKGPDADKYAEQRRQQALKAHNPTLKPDRHAKTAPNIPPSMDIESDWDLRRPSGEAGIKAAEAAAKKANTVPAVKPKVGSPSPVVTTD